MTSVHEKLGAVDKAMEQLEIQRTKAAMAHYFKDDKDFQSSLKEQNNKT